MDKIEKFQNLYKRYKLLVEKTSIRDYSVSAGGKLEVTNVAPTDLEEKIQVEKELKEGLLYLSDNQLIDLSSDVVFSIEAQETLTKRLQVQ